MILSITPFLWYDHQAEEAVNLYASLIPGLSIGEIRRYPDGSPHDMGGRAMSVSFSFGDQKYIAFNGGPHFSLSPAFSLMVSVETQEEVDHLWHGLIGAGGEESRCGWLVDPYGLSWQIVPTALGRLMGDRDQAKAGRVMQAMFQMNRLIIADLQRAYDGV